MRSLKAIQFVFCFLALGAYPGIAQISIEFPTETGTILPDFGHIRLGYPACADDGTLLLNMMIDPLKSHDTHVVAVSPNGHVQTFDFRDDARFSAPTLSSFSAWAGGVDLLVSSYPSDSYRRELGTKASTQFLLRYDSEGHLLKVTPLTPSYRFVRIANDSRGHMMAFFMDKKTQVASLGELGADGNVQSNVSFAEPLIEREDALSYFSLHNATGLPSEQVSLADRVEVALRSGFQLKSFDGKVVLLRTTGLPKIFSLDANGNRAVIPISTSSVAEVRSIFPGDGSSWTLIGFPKGSVNASLIQFDTTGQYQSLLHTSTISEASAICKSGNTYYGLGFPNRVPTLYRGTFKSADRSE